MYEKELEYYIKKTNVYGTPPDSRREYTKSDWILWCVAMTKNQKQVQGGLYMPLLMELKQK